MCKGPYKHALVPCQYSEGLVLCLYSMLECLIIKIKPEDENVFFRKIRKYLYFGGWVKKVKGNIVNNIEISVHGDR